MSTPTSTCTSPTLFSLAPVEEALRPVGVPLPLFFTRLLRDGFALAAAGGHKPFREVAASPLRVDIDDHRHGSPPRKRV